MKTNRVAAALVVFGLFSEGLAAAAPAITIRLVNSAKVSGRIVMPGEKQAGRVMAQAGIDVVWRDCSGAEPSLCGPELTPGEFWLHVANWKPADASPQELGFTLLEGKPDAGASLAGVYYPMVREMAALSSMEEAVILAAALAHEMGHLLGEGHSPNGVMSVQFDRRHIVEMSQGGFVFSRDQAARMRASVIRRTAVGQHP